MISTVFGAIEVKKYKIFIKLRLPIEHKIPHKIAIFYFIFKFYI